MRRGRARSGHEIPDRAPLRVAVGEVVEVGRRDTDWPAFVFVTAAAGTGWVPSRYLSHDSGTAVVRTAYDTTELPTTAGQQVDILDTDDDSGWHWCRAADGRTGWVPMSTIDAGPDPAG